MSTAASPRFSDAIIVMGVTSCGKTSVGKKLAAALGAPFIEGDALHPPANIAKMSSGTALNDDDRWPWLQKIGEALQGEDVKVASCSSLKTVYRQKLSQAAGRPVTFIYLHGSREVLAARIAARKGHFMPPSLLDSQLATLEPPTDDEKALRFDIGLPVKEIVSRALAQLTNGGAS
jgi:gluconokinase